VLIGLCLSVGIFATFPLSSIDWFLVQTAGAAISRAWELHHCTDAPTTASMYAGWCVGPARLIIFDRIYW